MLSVVCIGEEFKVMCMGRTGGSSGAVFIALCEDTAELVIRWKDTGRSACTI